MLQSMGSQRVRYKQATELKSTEVGHRFREPMGEMAERWRSRWGS